MAGYSEKWDGHVYRNFPHSNSNKEIVNRTRDDNEELHEYSSETFQNRKGGLKNIPDVYSDEPASTTKYPVKPKGGTRNYKGSETIRKMKEENNDDN